MTDPVSPATERLTLHFDLRHVAADSAFTLFAFGKEYPVRAHSPDTHARHAAENQALALVAGDRRAELTHFVEDVEAHAESVGLIWVGYPSADGGALLPEIAALAIHVPIGARRRALRRRLRAHARADAPHRVPLALARHGVEAVPHDRAEHVLLAATRIHGPISSAKMVLASHPEVASIKPHIAADVLDHYIELVLERDSSLVVYIAQNGPGTPAPWYTQTVVEHPDGTAMPPDTTLQDRNGQPVVWPERGGQPVIPRFHLSDEVIAAATPAVQLLLQLTKSAPELKGELWNVRHGIPSKAQHDVAPHPPLRAAARAPAAPAAPRFKWTMNALTSQYGIDMDSEVRFDPATNEIAFAVKNWANRSLGAFVQFREANGQPIVPPDAPHAPDASYDPSILYQRLISPGNVIFGIPVDTNYEHLSLTMPPNAVRLDLLLGGLGHGAYDEQLHLKGTIGTCVICYGIPSLLLMMAVGLQSTSWYTRLMASNRNQAILFLVAAPIFGTAVGESTRDNDSKSVLSKAGGFIAGIIFAKAMSFLARRILGYATNQQLMQSVPFVGWALRILSCTNAIADMIATTVEVSNSPKTYDIAISRAIDVRVRIQPDPAHGTTGQAPIWPQTADRWQVQIRHGDGMVHIMNGPLPEVGDQPLDVLFTDIPAGPDDDIQITAVVTTPHGWLAGSWIGHWMKCLPTEDTTLEVSGSIIEALVPLSKDTFYSHKYQLAFDSAQRKHVWQRGPAPQATAAARDCRNDGGLCDWLGITINDDAYALGYGWRAAGQHLPPDARAAAPIDAQLYAFQNVSALAHPEAGMKVPAIGMTLKPAIAYDQFGPKPLFVLPGSAQPFLDDRNLTGAIRNGFAAAGSSRALPDGAAIAVVTADLEWTISAAGSPLYHLSVVNGPGGASLIEVFADPATTLLFTLPIRYRDSFNSGVLPADVARQFAAASRDYTLPEDAQVTVNVETFDWSVGRPGQKPLYQLRRETDTIRVFPYPAPRFSDRNFFLDPRGAANAYVRSVSLFDGQASFDYDGGRSWGAIVNTGLANASVDAMVVHPAGFVLAVDYVNHKLYVLKLPAAAGPDAAAPVAIPMSGKGIREGLLLGPRAMTVTPDGRVLVLEQDNARIQAFDVLGNPVQCFAGPIAFTLDAALARDLDAKTASVAMLQAFQAHVTPTLARLFDLPAGDAAALDAGRLPADLVASFARNGIDLSASLSVAVTTRGSIWLLRDEGTTITYEIRLDAADGALDVFRGAAFTFDVLTRGRAWLVRDRTNTLTFAVSLDPDRPRLNVSQRIATMPLKPPDLEEPADVTWLDVAAEAKSFIYVLSHVGKGSQPSDYRLDLYNPDGTWLARTPRPGSSMAAVNGARLTVDQWRNLYTLNYQAILGPGGRTEPSVSIWIPSTPGD